jgi:Putative auto-transporter adhesin, head GIN domain
MMLGLGACGTRGNGEPSIRQFEELDLSQLHGVDVGGVFVLKAERSSDAVVELQGDGNLLPLVDVDVQDGVLRARTHATMRPDLELVLVVRAPTLRQVELSGAARGEIVGLAGDAFELEVDGAGEARVEGAVDRFTLEVSGASRVDAARLIAGEVVVEASGASSAEVTANVAIDAEASGASDIRWGGDAQKIARDASGASSIERR